MTESVNERNQKILRRVKRLLSLSDNNPNEEEAQSAFLMAQKLMVKNDISLSQIDIDSNETRDIKEGQVTVHKKLYWWERLLAAVMSENFRVKYFLNWKRKAGSNRKNAIFFMGFESDVQLAKEMYLLAYEAIVHFSKEYTETYYEENNLMRTRGNTIMIKDSYMKGFIDGLENKFEEQVQEMRSEGNALMVLVPKEVEDKYEESITGKSIFSIPSIGEVEAYRSGYDDGNKIDYTRSTIDEKAL